MNTITVTLLLLLVAALTINGAPMNTRQRCLCNRIQKTVRCPNISEVRHYPPSPYCHRTEIVVRRRKGDPVCLDPASRLGKRILSSNLSPLQWHSVKCGQ
ncbi:growth-regulated protein homolog gamma-like [Engraulis encrasicolus]|uniref:growth-regulated protein homolog gamma-like n=1 Tax=Engraulis encrasicolus TaxID=184585 RepID=UPI002FCFAD3F